MYALAEEKHVHSPNWRSAYLNGVRSSMTYAKAPIARSGFTLSYVRNATI